MARSESAKANQNAKKLFTSISKLIEQNYGKRLNNDEQFILNCLISEMDCQNIATVHGKLKVERVQDIAVRLMEKLSNCLERDVSFDNFQSVIKEYLSLISSTQDDK